MRWDEREGVERVHAAPHRSPTSFSLSFPHTILSSHPISLFHVPVRKNWRNRDRMAAGVGGADIALRRRR
jgi:hypothetical protein